MQRLDTEQLYFYPRPPRGGRLMVGTEAYNNIIFLSTPSARRATIASKSPDAATIISIHALREEGDRRSKKNTSPEADFYPRPPRGGRRTCWR